MVWPTTLVAGAVLVTPRSACHTSSKAPMSQTLTWGRAMPRWSAPGQPALEAALMAGLPASRARVCVGPPLSARAPSRGSVLRRSPAAGVPHWLVLSRLLPCEAYPSPLQLSCPAAPTPPATIVFLSENVPSAAPVPPATLEVDRFPPEP